MSMHLHNKLEFLGFLIEHAEAIGEEIHMGQFSVQRYACEIINQLTELTCKCKEQAFYMDLLKKQNKLFHLATGMDDIDWMEPEQMEGLKNFFEQMREEHFRQFEVDQPEDSGL